MPEQEEMLRQRKKMNTSGAQESGLRCLFLIRGIFFRGIE